MAMSSCASSLAACASSTGCGAPFCSTTSVSPSTPAGGEKETVTRDGSICHALPAGSGA